jgi:hypothetical protein
VSEKQNSNINGEIINNDKTQFNLPICTNNQSKPPILLQGDGGF